MATKLQTARLDREELLLANEKLGLYDTLLESINQQAANLYEALTTCKESQQDYKSKVAAYETNAKQLHKDVKRAKLQRNLYGLGALGAILLILLVGK